MKKLSILIFLILNVSLVFSQNKNTQDSVVVKAIDGCLVATLSSDKQILDFKNQCGGIEQFVYPLVIVNNVIIRDSVALSYFRNYIYDAKILRHQLRIDFDKLIFVRLTRNIKVYSKEKAEKKGIPDVPKDGVIILKTKRRCYIDIKQHT